LKRQHESRNLLRSVRSALLTVLVLAVAFVVWRFAFSAVSGAPAGSGSSPLPTATPSAPATWTPWPAGTIQAMSTRRANNISVELTRRSPLYTPEVTTDWAKVHQEVATRLAEPRPTIAPYRGFAGYTPAGVGWLERGLPGYYNHNEAVTNGWYEVEEGGTVMTTVFGGAEWADEASASPGPQGLVVVDVWQIAPDRLSDSVVYQQTFDTPGASGEVTITGAQGERLILQSTDGTTFYFDVPTRQFVPSLAATVTAPPPTTGPVSPLATATPVP